MATVKKQESATLYALRGVAALLVFFVHFSHYITPIITPIQWLSHGVPIFYILTGYFTCVTLLRNKNFSKATFLKRRASVLLPPYYLVLILTVLLMKPFYITTEHGIHVLLAHMFAVQSFFPGFGGAINGTLWMLSYSFLFYVIATFLSPWLKTAKHTLMIAFVLITLSIIWRSYTFYFHPVEERPYLGLGFFTPFGYIAFGMILASMHYFKHINPLSFFQNKKTVIISIISMTIFLLLFTQYHFVLHNHYWGRAHSMIGYPLLQSFYLRADSICKCNGLTSR
ncbi:acyltransferase family protein [Ostreibacterium oceani]|uniref:Acyltransferase family protein n=1 Tax=Ostreibacterium oceani TaxID=2654998 RepID=A0A6N7EWK2_9GAMM|nr:acyltransferase family protein [Ostreibacterium oceani]MPV86293.1 acyltransferase family protein [Ostreibacterium oceani]